jgi:hypothetical protein
MLAQYTFWVKMKKVPRKKIRAAIIALTPLISNNLSMSFSNMRIDPAFGRKEPMHWGSQRTHCVTLCRIPHGISRSLIQG